MASIEESDFKSGEIKEIPTESMEDEVRKSNEVGNTSDGSTTNNESDPSANGAKPRLEPGVDGSNDTPLCSGNQSTEDQPKDTHDDKVDAQLVSTAEDIPENPEQQTDSTKLPVNESIINQEEKATDETISTVEHLDRGDFKISEEVKSEGEEEMDTSEPEEKPTVNTIEEDISTDKRENTEKGIETTLTVQTNPDSDDLHQESVHANVSSDTPRQIDLQISPVSSESGLAREVQSIMKKSSSGENSESDKVEDSFISEVPMEEDDALTKKTTSPSDLSEQSIETSVSEKSDCANESEISSITMQSSVKQPIPQESAFKLPQETDKQDGKVPGKSYASEFEKFLHFSPSEEVDSSTDLQMDSKPDNQITFKRKSYEMDESDSSNWYKPSRNGTDPIDAAVASTSFGSGKGLLHTAVRRLLPQDDNSNSSMPDSITGTSFMEENSCLSSQDEISNVDETSNMSASDSFLTPAYHTKPDINLLDESANLNAPNNKSFVRSDTPTSVVSESTTPKRIRRGTLAIAAEEASEHRHDLTARDLFEYQWPQESGAEWYMLQEQISTYLNVKSFKRKHPDLFRRVCDKLEKEFLREKGVVSETQSDLGLTAVKSEEIHELLNKDYPARYQEYCVVLHEKERQNIEDKHKHYDVPRVEKSKIKEYTKKAMKSASEWNVHLQRERKEERRAYFDMQTFVMHYPQSKFRRATPDATKVGAYPISLIPGQFQEYCKRYTQEELKYFPLNTALYDPPKKMNRLQKQTTPEPDSDTPEEKRQSVSGSVSDSDDDSSSNSDASSVAASQKNVPGTDVKVETTEPAPELVEKPSCRICTENKDKKKKPKKEEDLVQCSECKRSGHLSCLDLTTDMGQVIKTYPWQCMECKTCVECMDPYDEDKMLFCDRCDRGYHTFCVGLKSLPTGSWECTSCKSDTASTRSNSQKATPKSKNKSRRSRK